MYKSILKQKAMNSKKLIVGIVAGLAVGTVIGMLFAPEDGKRIRKKMIRMGEEITDNLNDKFHKFIGSLNEKIENTMEDVSNFAERANETSEQVDDGSNQN